MKGFGNFIVLGITEADIHNPDALRKLVSAAADKGFEGLSVYVCSSFIGPEDPEAVEALRVVGSAARERGMKTMVFIRPTTGGLLRPYPDAHANSLERVAVPVKEGEQVRARLDYPYNDACFTRIAGVFLLEGERGENSYHSYRDLTPEWGGDFEIESTIVLDRPRKARAFQDRIKQVVLDGKAPADGLLVIYGLFRTKAASLGSPRVKEWVDTLMERYRDLPLDGLNWDEPGLHSGAGIDWQRRYWCEAVRRHAARWAGEDILPRCLLLDYRVEGTEWPLVRQAYYHALIDCIRDNQLYIKKKGRETFGPETELGVHHTWYEIDSMDLFVGNIDYFYLADTLTSGYADNEWYFGDEAMVYTSVLARSLARKTETDLAYSNSWDFSPREEGLDRATQILALTQVHFYHIGVGDHGSVYYPHHHVWELMPRYLERLKRVQGLLADMRPATEIATVHGWESLPRISNDCIHAHRFALVYLAHQAVMDSRRFEFVGTDMFAGAEVEGDKISFGKDTYRTLIVPWPLVLPAEVGEKLDSFIGGGGRVIFFGPPAAEDTHGNSTRERFSRWLGGARTGEEPEGAVDPASDPLEWIGEGTREVIDPCYDPERKMEVRAREKMKVEDVTLPVHPLEPAQSAVFLRWQDKPVGVSAPGGKVYYVSFDFVYYEEVTRRLLALVSEKRPLEVPENVVFREFLPARPKSRAKGYVFVARRGNRMEGQVKVGGQMLDLGGKGIIAVRLEGDSVTDVVTG